ncbi:hypothetical protein Sjap_021695 [Stephania japonica]|uniref:Uncharacterized protein n=1 Tax=Stephania japonica TaxID=461633 RepID=A0AAP0ET54_9MAGN
MRRMRKKGKKERKKKRTSENNRDKHEEREEKKTTMGAIGARAKFGIAGNPPQILDLGFLVARKEGREYVLSYL